MLTQLTWLQFLWISDAFGLSATKFPLRKKINKMKINCWFVYLNDSFLPKCQSFSTLKSPIGYKNRNDITDIQILLYNIYNREYMDAFYGKLWLTKYKVEHKKCDIRFVWIIWEDVKVLGDIYELPFVDTSIFHGDQWWD